MLVSDYDAFVQKTDQFAHRSQEDRLAIAILGLAGEIGSLISVVKKQMLGELQYDQAPREVREELGDIMWYCFSLAQIANTTPINIFTLDIANLKRDMSNADEQSQKIQRYLDRSKRTEFLDEVARFPRTDSMEFVDYQRLAFLTARTEGITLLRVCLAVLAQLAAELMRHYLPASERDINTILKDRTTNQIIGEIAWHTSALASLMWLSLDDVAEENQRKVAFRSNRSVATALHDEGYKPDEQLPRQFNVTFVTIAPGRSRMYWQGRRLGNDLTDNAYDRDGYRFHDVMHLANAAKLGWSPVLRKLMDRKRRSDINVDEVEDGARAAIVEELIVKAIHAEGERVARARDPHSTDPDLNLFENRQDVTFRFLHTLRGYADGLEVAENRYWEWEDAIIVGCEIFRQLKLEGQGTVSVNLETREIHYRPEVDLDLSFVGAVVGVGLVALAANPCNQAQEIALQQAALQSLDLADTTRLRKQIDVELAPRGRDRPRLRARGKAALALCAKSGVTLSPRISATDLAWSCSVIALGDLGASGSA